jgi:Tfp pilus assembly protein PilX
MLKAKRRNSRKQEKGVALLISIFVLLIISAVGLAMVFATSTESSLAGNYKLSTTARYAAMAGLEEARGRMLPKSPNYLNDAVTPNFMPATGIALATNQVRYILNPAPGEVVAPTNLANSTTYPDNEYATEYGQAVTAAVSQTKTSVSPLNNGTIPGPTYKWVRITPATEFSLNIDVNNDSNYDNTVSLFYDAAAATPSLMLGVSAGAGNPATAPTPTAKPVFEVTALAVVPGGGEKLLQYAVTATTYNLTFPSALNLPGSNVAFNGANSNQWYADGVDGSGNPPPVAGCVPNQPPVSGVGVTNVGGVNNVTNVLNGIPSGGGGSGRDDHYLGAPIQANGQPTYPSVSNVTMNPTMQTPAELSQLIQNVSQNADVVISGNATQANMPSQMSATNPMTIVVDGDFSMTGNYTGYGLLVVTGNFAYSGTTGWKGIVLVIGQGTTTFLGAGGGNNEFDGAIMAATIKDASGNLLPALGADSFDISGGGGNGVYYNSCWINSAQSPPTYKMLSFREIQYND